MRHMKNTRAKRDRGVWGVTPPPPGTLELLSIALEASSIRHSQVTDGPLIINPPADDCRTIPYVHQVRIIYRHCSHLVTGQLMTQIYYTCHHHPKSTTDKSVHATEAQFVSQIQYHIATVEPVSTPYHNVQVHLFSTSSNSSHDHYLSCANQHLPTVTRSQLIAIN